jgi:hypothetical protein
MFTGGYNSHSDPDFVCQCGIYLVENWNKKFSISNLKEKEISVSLKSSEENIASQVS